MSKTTTLVSACKDTPWTQVACTVALSTPAIIDSYDATKNNIIVQVPANNISGRSGSSIG